MTVINLVTPKAAAKHELLFNKPALSSSFSSWKQTTNVNKRTSLRQGLSSNAAFKFVQSKKGLKKLFLSIMEWVVEVCHSFQLVGQTPLQSIFAPFLSFLSVSTRWRKRSRARRRFKVRLHVRFRRAILHRVLAVFVLSFAPRCAFSGMKTCQEAVKTQCKVAVCNFTCECILKTVLLKNFFSKGGQHKKEEILMA